MEPEVRRLVEAAWRQINPAELVGLARDLVRIPSVYRPGHPDGNESAVARYLVSCLRDDGFEVHTDDVAPGRPNVWALHRGTRPGRTLLFEAHTDVVTEGPGTAWRHPPFAAELVGRRLYGRGACDTKGNLAAAVVALRAIRRSGVPFPGRLILCCPVDEEGMMAGIKRFIRQGHAAGVDAAVICEPEGNELCLTQKGALRIEVRVQGKMAHGAMPLSGVNPVTRAARFVAAVEALECEEIARHGAHPLLGQPSITPTVLLCPEHGEPQLNVVPAGAYLALDVRTIPGQSHPEIVDRLRGVIAALRAEDLLFEATLDVIDDRPWTQTGRDSPIARSAAIAYTAVTGEAPRYNGVPGATDGTFLHAWAGIPIVTTGAGDRLVPHQADEWVDVDELHLACRLYAATALQFCCS